MRSYLTAFLNRVYDEFNDIFSCNSSDSLSRDPKDSSKNKFPSSNPPTQSDQDKVKGNQEMLKSIKVPERKEKSIKVLERKEK